MAKRILSASVGEDMAFEPGVNILRGPGAEKTVLTLAGLFGGIPPQNGKAEILWDGALLAVSIADGACTVDSARGRNIPQLVKNFHKQRFLHFKNQTHILDAALPGNGEAVSDDRPLFVIHFDGDLQRVFAPGRQIFIAAN